MNKKITLLLVILLTLPYIVYALTNFTIQETEKISLVPNATDPDADNLVTTYSSPLNENGEWQTIYGDAGEYKVTITVSDGITNTSKDVLLTVEKKEEPPEIVSFIPEQDNLNINEGSSINFRIFASDLNKDKLSYEWFLDDEKLNEGNEYTYNPSYNDSGIHKISVEISDGTANISKEWNVNVQDVDIGALLDEIKDVSVNEEEAASIKLPNFEDYGLRHFISEPIGDKNLWKTTYNDSGIYYAKVHAEGRGFSGDKIVKVVVNDVDRPPVFEKISGEVIDENEELNISLNAYDPDNDNVTYSAINLPRDANFNGKIFTWKPGYDTVRKEGFVDAVMDKFRVLSKSFYVQFGASAKDKKIIQNMIITVKDVNRAPILEDMEPITINEEETLKITPKAYDLDGDTVSLRYSGFITADNYKSNFGDAGTYYVKVTASDGLLETSKFVQISINHVNRAPVFGKMQDINAKEGEDITLLLNAYDPDGDEISYSIDNPPEGSSLKGNAFFWKLDLNFANKQETKQFNLVFVANDGKAETRQILKADISYKNRPPKIVDATKNIVVKINEPVLMFVKAEDEDGDGLTYTWDFGLFEKYKATPTHQRIFTSRGTKVVKVIVSDGVDESEQIINVVVV